MLPPLQFHSDSLHELLHGLEALTTPNSASKESNLQRLSKAGYAAHAAEQIWENRCLPKALVAQL